MSSTFCATYISPIGPIKINCKDNKLISLQFTNHKERSKSNNFNNCAKKVITQLDEYFLGKRKRFSLPFELEGTTFEQKVWREILRLKFGETISYKNLAININHPKAIRAVANACGKNKLPLIIPCHRVVSSNSIGGYSAGISKKKYLLNLELVDIKSF
ncbi:cysteine methyltransferase [Candidatus Woesearchaeota archaeon CG10_big_fil_rev_8_21_14_0_10_32_9]|nr:MAG: cysteine methyltransferase [Candidatus Woesearchaeota archaeon CG10_big_fil_rev_8_21_14_0_10_32_9]